MVVVLVVVEVMDDGDDKDDVIPDSDGFTQVFCQFFRSYFCFFLEHPAQSAFHQQEKYVV